MKIAAKKVNTRFVVEVVIVEKDDINIKIIIIE